MSWPYTKVITDSIDLFNFEIHMYLRLGDTLSAQTIARRAIATAPDRITAYYVLGDLETANRNLLEKYDFDSEDAGEFFILAEVYATMQDTDNALKYLRKAFELGYYYGRKWIQDDYELYNLRNLPEFKALIDEYTEKQKR